MRRGAFRGPRSPPTWALVLFLGAFGSEARGHETPGSILRFDGDEQTATPAQTTRRPAAARRARPMPSRRRRSCSASTRKPATRTPARRSCAAFCPSLAASRCDTAAASSRPTTSSRSPASGSSRRSSATTPSAASRSRPSPGPTILGELRRHFRDRVWTLRVPRGLQESIRAVEDAITKLSHELERSPTVAEIADLLETQRGRRARGVRGQRRAADGLARPADPRVRARRRGADGRADRRRRPGLRAGRGPGRDRRRLRRPRRDRARGPTAALRRGPDAVEDRRAGRLLADARLAHPAPRARKLREAADGRRRSTPDQRGLPIRIASSSPSSDGVDPDLVGEALQRGVERRHRASRRAAAAPPPVSSGPTRTSNDPSCSETAIRAVPSGKPAGRWRRSRR